MTRPRRPRARVSPYRQLLHAGKATAALLVLTLAAYLIGRLLVRLAPITMAVIAALLLTALLLPVSNRLRRIGAPGTPAALAAVAFLLASLAGTAYLIGQRATAQLDDLRNQVVEGADQLRRTVLDTLPGLNQSRLDEISAQLIGQLRDALPSAYTGITTATEVLAAMLLAVVLLFFFLRDGSRMWTWLTGLVPGPRAQRLHHAGHVAWHALASYTHGVVLVAAIDAVGIGVVLLLLDVPLALSLAVLTFLAAFIPIIGATVAGAAAARVTLVTNGVSDAVLVLVAVIVVQQVEGNLLHPIIMRRAVRLHPAVTLLAVSAGVLLLGIAGALIAVPACAVIYQGLLAYRGRQDPPERTPTDAGSGGTAADETRRPASATDGELSDAASEASGQ